MSRNIIYVPENMPEETITDLVYRLVLKYNLSNEPEIVIDNSLIGGFVLNCDGQVTDCSIKTQLSRIKDFISGSK